ncbi:J domain-containing protein [Jiangella mangrovi]|uniref:J domain-containing protein n=1 Tax=Jiangella mangrovi TaxID=1524084 RepID=A0A7W9LJJ1_9ACTN|nr:J domain-containing protein [Jiangella mangrovi]MBB5786146.1 hypothetical protein [Jiangella mangrovi]
MKADIAGLGGADPHDVLGVRVGASPQQVNRAFHREALRGGHPDTGGDALAFRRLVVARDALLAQPQVTPSSMGVRTGGAGPTTATPRPPRPPHPPQPPPGPGRAAARSSDASAIPLILLFLAFFVGVPHVLLALVLMLVP